MALVVSISHPICLILVHMIFLNIVESQFPKFATNVNTNASSYNDRSKRSPLFDRLPSELRMTVKYITGQKADLTFTKTSQFLANEYLPVIRPHVPLTRSVLEDIGEFVFYQDQSKSSAVVYFEKYNTLYGVIGMNHYIQDLPFDFNEYGNYQSAIVGEPYVKEHAHPFHHIDPSTIYPPPSETDAWYDFLSPSTDDFHRNLEHPITSGSGVTVKRPRIDQNNKRRDEEKTTVNEYQMNAIDAHNRNPNFKKYIHFIICSYVRSSEEFFGRDKYVEWIGRYLIIYFNAVDMMFQKLRLPHINIHINIAKIVIEDELSPFPYSIDNENLQFTHISDAVLQYLLSHTHEYPPDSFDHIFIYTSQPIFDDVVQIEGWTKHGMDIYAARQKNYFYEAVPMTIVRFQYYYADYTVAVHEIGRIFGMKIESRKRKFSAKGQCSGIMQRQGPKCKDCLKWSDDSRFQIEQFFRNNNNRCFLLNKPRSLRPIGVSSYLPSSGQCRCFGYYPPLKGSTRCVKQFVGVKGCSVPLQCRKSDASNENVLTILPLDGTPCSPYKSCWGGRCLDVTVTNKP